MAIQTLMSAEGLLGLNMMVRWHSQRDASNVF